MTTYTRNFVSGTFRILSMCCALITLAIFAPLARAAQPSAEAAAPATDRIVVMISLDGLAGYYLDDPQAEMPTLRMLADQGARASTMKASNPTVTWTNHTTLVTGVEPAKHGVVGNNYFDRASGKRVVLICDPTFDKDEAVRALTIYDIAHEHGLKTAAMRWPATRNASTLDWNSPDIALVKLLDQYTTPALLTECKTAGLELDYHVDSKDVTPTEEANEIYTKAFNLILHEHRPNLALLHLANVDRVEHASGPKTPEAYAAIKLADDEVRSIWDELQRDFPGKATLLVVSDHGFSSIDHSILPNVVLKKSGLVEVTGSKATGGSVQVVVQGGAALVYILDRDRRDEIAKQVKEAFAGLNGVSKVVDSAQFKDYGVADPKDDPHAPDMILFADEGYVFGDTAAGALPYNEKPEHAGSHGHDASLPDLHATFIACGAGIKPHAQLGEIENIDVAPTIAKLLGLPMPDVDGKPLTAALAD